MRNERKYKIISLLTMLLALLLLGNFAREYWRMETAVYRQHEEYVLKGARVYAQNCVQCHGPRGEGVIGIPLNRSELKADYTSPAGKEVYNMIFETIRRGRPGNSDHFQWEKAPDGRWISYTEMPAWSKEYGGPLDDDYIKALTLFIMKEDGSQWALIGTGSADEYDPSTAPFQKPNYDVDENGEIPLPDSEGLSAERNAAAKALLRNLGKSQCLTCHTIGSRGSYIGPDLSKVGSWGIDKEFLMNWIKFANVNPNAPDEWKNGMPHDKRMPVYWMANRAIKGTEPTYEDTIVSEGPYYMPSFYGRLTDEEIELIADYLLGLK